MALLHKENNQYFIGILFKKTFIEVQLIYNIILISVVWHSNLVFHILYSINLLQNNSYNSVYNILLLLIYFIHSSLYLFVPYPYFAPHSIPLPTGNSQFVSCICESVSVLLYTFVCFIFQIPHISDIKHLAFSDLFH